MSDPTAGVPPLVASILEGKAPDRIRSAAARGALPLPQAQLIQLFVHLLEDSDASIGEAAEQSLETLDRTALEQVLAEETCAPSVLVHFAAAAARDPALAEPIAFNKSTPSKAISVLALKGSPAVVELVLTNEERLRADPAQLEALMSNATLRADQRGRILELLERLDRDGLAETLESSEGEDSSVEELAQLLDVDVGELLSRSEIVDGHEFVEAEEVEIRDAYRKIVTLNTAQKAILAMKGGREERQILIRDSNKTVSSGVLKNPRITDSEVEAIANMRNVSEHILRMLAGRREWTKSYSVVHYLIQNPRSPQAVSMNFISRLTSKDLSKLIGNREVPELIRRAARRTFDQRNKKSSPFR